MAVVDWRLRKRSRRGGGGFSLIETLVAVSIFAIAIVAVIEGLAASSRAQIWVERENRAVMLAQNILEEIEYAGDLEVGTDQGRFEDEDSDYSWSSEVVETPDEGLYQVTVVVSWNEGEAEREFQLTTYVRQSATEGLATPYGESGTTSYGTMSSTQ